MAGFTLGGNGSTSEGATQQPLQSESLFQLYSGNRIQQASSTTRGFELWQHHQQQIQREEHHNLYPSSVGSLLAFSNEPGLQVGGIAARTIELSMRGHGGGGTISCQDCGNQAKKDCVHLRCRTCCKSRGFPCSTHIKSTWVPAAKRRERQQQLASAAALHQQQQQAQQLKMSSKRPREAMAVTTVSSGDGGMETAVSFPTEVTSPAVFRCVRVSSVDDIDEEVAYQTAVSIGGHVFKGILYDHGMDSQYISTPTTGRHGSESLSFSANASAGAINDPNNEATIPTAIAIPAPNSTAIVTAGNSTVVDANSLYPTPFSAFMAGTQFFPHNPRPN